MVSAVDTAKRVLVTLLKSLAGIYGVVLALTRESTDVQLKAAYKKVSRKAHTDKGGSPEHQKALSAARDAWEEALREVKTRGGDQRTKKPQGRTVPSLVHDLRETPGYRFRGVGVLLTYQKFTDTGCWQAFLDHTKARLVLWKAKFWCATMETNSDGTYHLHLMLQFYAAKERQAQTFAFSGKRPNAQTNDLLGEGWCKRKLQQSLDRGFFYVWANKVGTVRGGDGELLVAGNYEPAWTRAQCTYTVAGSFLDKLFKAYKLSEDVYEEYVYLARDGVSFRKRNLDECRERARELRTQQEVATRTKRIRENPRIYQPFKTVPEAQRWLKLFQEDALRYPLLVVSAPSYCGKTEWGNSLFQRPLEVKVGVLGHFPEGMRRFDKEKFDGLVLDDVRDLTFLSDHQEKLQGNPKKSFTGMEIHSGRP
jgi:curved DNA-binding protein CbpA